MSPIFNNSFVKLTLNTALAYGAAYAARPYLHLNPTHTALFSLGTNIAMKIAKEFVNFAGRQTGYNSYRHSLSNTLAGRTTIALASYAPVIVTVAKGTFSPHQAVTAIGLTFVSNHFYSTATGYSTMWQ